MGRPEAAILRQARQARYSVRYLLNGYPAIYLPLARLRHGAREDRLVRRDTELVIEGFGRSGNTFAVVAFQLVQDRPVRVVHHTHAAAQIIRAVKLGIPTVLLVRDPVDTAVSHMMYRNVAAPAALRAWSRYHRRLISYRGGFVAARFEVSTTDLGAVIREVNRRFGTSFEEFRHTDENVRQVYAQIERLNRARYGRVTETISRPTAGRDRRKGALRGLLEEERLGGLRERAYRIYRDLLTPAGP
jgi:hypothetical protein